MRLLKCNVFIENAFFLYSDTINALVIYEYIAQGSMDQSPAFKALVTKPSIDLIQVGVRGFSRTLLIAGLSNGRVAVLKWDTGEIDFSLDVSLDRTVRNEIERFDLDAFESTGC